MAKDYYMILGVNRKASQKQIKDAYRKLVVKFHPDKDPDANRERFLEIQEAYETLSDKERRKQYNAELERSEKKRDEIEPEPFYQSAPWERDIGNIFSDIDNLFNNLREAFFGHGRRRATGREGLQVEILLDHEEAKSGGSLTLDIPVYVQCSACRGRGRRYSSVCPHCGGSGRLRREKEITIDIPAGTRDNTYFELPLDNIGLRGATLVIRFRVR